MRYNGVMAARRSAREKRKSSAYVPWVVAGAIILAFAAMVLALARQPRPEGGPRVGSHWHARYTIEICGKALPPLPLSHGDVHTHGDGVIHIHPATAPTSGRRANLDTFFRTTKVRLTASGIAIDGGPSYANGDTCPDGKPGMVKVLAQGAGDRDFKPMQDFLRYVPSDRDVMRIVFGP